MITLVAAGVVAVPSANTAVAHDGHGHEDPPRVEEDTSVGGGSGKLSITAQERVLILANTVIGGTSSTEAQEAVALGFAVDLVSDATWTSMTKEDFASYKAIILGDPDGTLSQVAAAQSTTAVWGPAVDGRVVIFGSDPAGHAGQGGAKFLRQGVRYATSSGSGRTGLLVVLSEYYDNAPANTPVPLLNAVGGGFTVRGVPCSNTIKIVAESEALDGVTEADLGGWGCSVHEAFDTWNSEFAPIAIAVNATSGTYTDANGNKGFPYILTRGGGTRVPPEQRRGGGNVATPYQQDCHRAEPVNCATGNFWHTFTDVEIEGRGPGLGVARTYNSDAAAEDSPFGFGWTSNATMRLAVAGDGSRTVSQENGSTVTFRPAAGGGYSAPPRVFATLTGNADGSYRFERLSRERFDFDAAGTLRAIEDLNGYRTTFGYDAGGLLETMTDSSGRELTFVHDTAGRISSVTDPLGRAVTYTYDTNGDLTSVDDVAGNTTVFTYGDHRLLTMTDPRGGTVTNTYDPQGRVIGQSDALNQSTTFAYEEFQTVVTDRRGNQEIMTFSADKLVAITKGAGTVDEATRTFTHDDATFARLTATDGNGNTTTYTYDTAGNIESINDELARSMTYVHGPRREVTSSTDPGGVTTTYTYDAAANLVSSTTPISATQSRTVTLTYGDPDHPGDITEVTDPNGHTW
ncbi:MAG TPA: DUF6531 domain-containing protein, partial [Acidimicrobiales bacterium]|nr:DUF6531 domain-containing protein [Acidimicrobiales bacterium]